jgi:hypothetical protein
VDEVYVPNILTDIFFFAKIIAFIFFLINLILQIQLHYKKEDGELDTLTQHFQTLSVYTASLVAF